VQIGFVGLGRMGGKENIDRAEGIGASGASSLAELVGQLAAPRTVWLMIPAGEPAQTTIDALTELLEPGDAMNSLAARAFEQHGNDLGDLSGFTEDSGEGRWTIEDAMEKDVPTPVITASLHARFYSRGDGEYTHRVLAALREQFGGHATQKHAE
jgi:6-phosphogluconate dehydrogenase (decarboxylating)